MNDRVVLLHVTDPHLSTRGVPLGRDDRKADIPALEEDTRENVLGQLFERLAEYLGKNNIQLNGVIFSGDAQMRGAPGGHDQLADLILTHLSPFGITSSAIVATPGNHDVPRDTPPSSTERYEAFNATWKKRGCVVPWLDGIDGSAIQNVGQHRLVGADLSWAVYPVNSSNWSHVTSILPEPLGSAWEKIPETLFPNDQQNADKIRKQLSSLARYDMARISHDQLEALRSIIESTPQPKHGHQLRIAVLHHHLRSPTLREEVKAFADLSNLEQLRALLHTTNVDIVVHGHKHEQAAYYELVSDEASTSTSRLLVVSGATFDAGREKDAMRLIEIQGLPYTPSITISPLPLPRAGNKWTPGKGVQHDLWIENRDSSGPVVITKNAPAVVVGSDIDEVYAKARLAAEGPVNRGSLVVHLDLDPDFKGLPFPTDYPFPSTIDAQNRNAWLTELVAWWQRDSSQLDHRMPYIHGGRLRRYGGKIDQIRRIISIIKKKDSTRALAVLVDPFRDFNPDGEQENFASFCLVEFRVREQKFLEAIAFYRAQEFARWWPVNIAELRMLQAEIADATKLKPGRITTITADARTIAKSPTQVAMPIIDRWLDQTPERFHLLADAFLNRTIRVESQQKAVEDWHRALEELRYGTKEFNNDGVPLAIEGLRMLARYVEISRDPSDQEALKLSQDLSSLADHNQTYDESKRDLAQFRLWAPNAIKIIDSVQTLTGTMLAT